MDSSQIDFQKLAKYSVHAPRYTSYPTAVEFKPIIPDKIYPHLQGKGPLSLYIHLPFCRSACYFCGCNVVYTSKGSKRSRYLDYLERELEIWEKYLDTSRIVRQLHFGGGTPTFFTPEELERLYQLIYHYFPNFEPEAEISVEVDPRYFSPLHMEVFKKFGVNRISFGVQDFNFTTQRAVNRVQSFELTLEMVQLARQADIQSINIDLIYGLPYQTAKTFRKTLEKVLELDPDRVAVFNYAHVPWLKKGMRKIDETTLPLPEEKLKIFKTTIDFFTSNGYKMVGMDHFAKPEDELFQAIEKGELHRNFQGYTTKGGAELIGIGVTSISETDRSYFQNYKNLKEWERAIDQKQLPIMRGIILTDEDLVRKYIIMEMMANFSFDITRFENRFKIDFWKKFRDEVGELKRFEEDGLLKINSNRIEVTPTGTLLIRNIVLPFDEYYKKMGNRKVFSKSV